MHIYGPGNITQLRDATLPCLTVDRIYQVPSRASEPQVYTWLREMEKLPTLRSDRVARIRRQIEMGEYELDKKLEAAVDHLLEDFFSS
jgi:hypothetical protein